MSYKRKDGTIFQGEIQSAFFKDKSGLTKGVVIIRDITELHREESTEFESKDSESTSTSFTLIISDNGVGIPESLDIENLDSLGIQLVTSLVDQLNSELELKVVMEWSSPYVHGNRKKMSKSLHFSFIIFPFILEPICVVTYCILKIISIIIKTDTGFTYLF